MCLGRAAYRPSNDPSVQPVVKPHDATCQVRCSAASTFRERLVHPYHCPRNLLMNTPRKSRPCQAPRPGDSDMNCWAAVILPSGRSGVQVPSGEPFDAPFASSGFAPFGKLRTGRAGHLDSALLRVGGLPDDHQPLHVSGRSVGGLQAQFGQGGTFTKS